MILDEIPLDGEAIHFDDLESPTLCRRRYRYRLVINNNVRIVVMFLITAAPIFFLGYCAGSWLQGHGVRIETGGRKEQEKHGQHSTSRMDGSIGVWADSSTQQIIDALVVMNASSVDAFRDRSSPQSMAASFLARTGIILLTKKSNVTMDKQPLGQLVLPTYAMTVLWFGTGGGNSTWSDTYRFLESDKVCDWQDRNAMTLRRGGVVCDDSNNVVAVELCK